MQCLSSWNQASLLFDLIARGEQSLAVGVCWRSMSVIFAATLHLISWNIGHNHAITIISSFLVKIWSQEQHIRNWAKTDTIWTRRPESGRPADLLWNLGIKLFQSHLEGESRPFQWVTSQNARVGTGRLEPLSNTEESYAMIRAQDDYPSRSDIQPLRSVSVQQRAKNPPEPGRPIQETSIEQTARSTDL
jgi:hypothetical protein